MGEGGELTPLNVKAVMVRAAVGMSPARTGQDAGPVGGGELGVNMEVTVCWECVCGENGVRDSGWREGGRGEEFEQSLCTRHFSKCFTCRREVLF